MEPEDIAFVTVFKAGDAATVALAKTYLEAAGIPVFAKDEMVQDFFAYGRLGTGFNPLTGPVRIQVPKERADEAREILEASLDDGMI